MVVEAGPLKGPAQVARRKSALTTTKSPFQRAPATLGMPVVRKRRLRWPGVSVMVAFVYAFVHVRVQGEKGTELDGAGE